MRKIAIEEHIHSQKLGEVRMRWAQATGRPDTIDRDFFMGQVIPRMMAPPEEMRLREMNENGIDMQVLSTGAPGVQGCLSAVEAVALAREHNDVISDMMRQYPGRFGGFAALPLQDPTAAAKELERCVRELGFCGAMLHGPADGRYLDAPEFGVVWEAAQQLEVPLSLHVQDSSTEDVRLYEGCYDLLGPGWSWNIEAATHALRLVLNGVFERYPKAQFIVGHMGEGLPYYLGRIDEGFSTFGGHQSGILPRLPSTYFRTNIHITTSGKYYPPTLRCAVDAMGKDRVLFAGDYPFVLMSEAVACLEGGDLTDDEKEHIYHLNAERLLGV